MSAQAFVKLVLMAILVMAVNGKFRIMGGTEMERNDVPYQVFIRMVTPNEKFRCGGVIYDEVNVVTAAHCCDGNITVHGGIHNVKDLDSRVQSIPVEKIKVHEDYDEVKYLNDVCMLHLTKPFVFNEYVQPAKFPQQDEPIEPFVNASVTGWGRLKYEEKGSDVLMGVDVPVLPNEECLKAHEDYKIKFNPITMVCAGTGKGRGTCKGDSGGPLTVDGVVVGITSWSHKVNNQCSRLPNNYARVAKYINWFEANKKPSDDKPNA